MSAEAERFENRLVSQTSSYLKCVDSCVDGLPTLISRYEDDGKYHDIAVEIFESESMADTANREICGMIAQASTEDLGARLTRIQINGGGVLELYQRIDEIANTAEQFAAELAAMAPTRRPSCLAKLQRMAEVAVAAMAHLKEAVPDYLQLLYDPDRPTTLANKIERIREMESTCDGVRNEVIATAFDQESVDSAHSYRELALLLDTVLDTIEDVTDHMILRTETQIDVKIDPAA